MKYSCLGNQEEAVGFSSLKAASWWLTDDALKVGRIFINMMVSVSKLIDLQSMCMLSSL